MCEVGREDSMSVLDKAATACPRKAEFYFFAARLALSQASGSEQAISDNVDRAVRWLTRCVLDYYSDLTLETLQDASGKVAYKRVLVLYR